MNLYLIPGESATSKLTGAEEQSITRDRKMSFRTELVTPKAQMSPIPESDAWEEDREQPEDKPPEDVYRVMLHLYPMLCEFYFFTSY